MLSAYDPSVIRAAEAPLLENGAPLMQRAAAGLAAQLSGRLRTHGGRRVLLLVGSGSNGGDAMHAGAILARRGCAVTALATGERTHPEGTAALRRAGGRLQRAADLDGTALAALCGHADVIVDGVLGIGGRPELSEQLRELLVAAQDAPAPVVAVDVPTGIDAATGEASPGAVCAAQTVTFGALKAGLLLPGALAHTGEITLVDIGLGEALERAVAESEAPVVRRLQDADVRALWPVPGPSDHKYSRGVVSIDAGSEQFPGAAVLSVSGAARSGAGMVRYRGPQAVLDLVLQRRPEVVGAEGRHQAAVIGSGLSPDDPRCRAGVLELMDPEGARTGVLDAGALGAIRPGDRFGADTVLTPHSGEAAKLAETLDIAADQPAPALASALAEATGATVLLKGAVTVVADGAAPRTLFSQADATPWLATAGAGDVLGGIVGTLLAAGLPGARAAALGALIHGRAAQVASRAGTAPLVALDIAEALPEALAAILVGAVAPAAGRGGA